MNIRYKLRSLVTGHRVISNEESEYIIIKYPNSVRIKIKRTDVPPPLPEIQRLNLLASRDAMKQESDKH